MIKVHVKGDEALLKTIRDLPGSFGRDILVTSLKAGGRKIQQEAKRNVPVNTGKLKKSLVVQESLVSKRSGRRDISIPPQIVVGATKPRSRLLHLVEFGHALRDGGFYPGTRFFTKALDSTSTEVYGVISSKLKQDFDKVSARISQQFNKLSAADKRKIRR